ACATPTSPPSRAASTTGRQSAVRMARTTPDVEVTAASASGSASSPAEGSNRSTRVPCTCRSQRGGDGRPARSASSARLRATVAGSSPSGARKLPRLKRSNGACEPPAPERSVVKARTPAGTSAGSTKISASGPPARPSEPLSRSLEPGSRSRERGRGEGAPGRGVVMGWAPQDQKRNPHPALRASLSRERERGSRHPALLASLSREREKGSRHPALLASLSREREKGSRHPALLASLSRERERG